MSEDKKKFDWRKLVKRILWGLFAVVVIVTVFVIGNHFFNKEEVAQSDAPPADAVVPPNQESPPLNLETEGPEGSSLTEEPVSETGLSFSELEEALMAEKAKNAELQAEVKSAKGEFGRPKTGPLGSTTQGLIDEAKGVGPEETPPTVGGYPLDRVFMARRPDVAPAREGLNSVPVGQRRLFLSPPVKETPGGQVFAILMVERDNLPPTRILLKEGESAKMPKPTPGTDGEYRIVPSGWDDGMSAIVTIVTDVETFNRFRQSMGWPN